ncbi:MAG: hypothetical protein ACXWKB_10445, partial [Methyloceanibacter sp.]
MPAGRIISGIAKGSGGVSARAATTIPDHELLVLILFRAVAGRDTPLAKAILARFGSFAEAMSAPDELLREV